MPWESDFVWKRNGKAPDRERSHDCTPVSAVSVQSVDDLVLFDPGSMSRSDTSENTSEDTESGVRRVEEVKHSYDMRAHQAKFTEGDWVWYYNPGRYVGRYPNRQRNYTGSFRVVGVLSQLT